MHFLLAVAILCSPITRFPGFFHLVTPVKASIAALILGWWFVQHREQWVNSFAKKAALGSKWPSQLAQVSVLLFALWIWIGLTTLLSAAPAKGIDPFLANLTVIAFFFPFLDLASRPQGLSWRLEWVLVAAATAVACLAILQYVVMQFGVLSFLVEWIIPKLDRDLAPAGGPFPLPDFGYRSWGTFHHANLLGTYLALAFPIAIVLGLGAKGYRPRGLFFLATLIIGGGIFCSGSRGAWLNVAVGLAVLIVLSLRRIPKIVFAATAIGLPLLGFIFQSKIHQYFRLGNILSNRDIIWRNTWTMITEHPFLGRGPGSFSRNYLDRFDFPSEIERWTATRELNNLGHIYLLDNWHAHNLYLHYAAEMGLLAAVLLLLIFLVYFKALVTFKFGLGSSSETSPRSLLVAGCAAAIAGNSVHSLLETSTNFAFPAIGISYILIFALGLASMQTRHETSE